MKDYEAEFETVMGDLHFYPFEASSKSDALEKALEYGECWGYIFKRVKRL